MPNTADAAGAAAADAAGATGGTGTTDLVDAMGHGAADGGVEFVGPLGGDGFLLDAPDPHVGMLFESLIDARNAYNAYAYRIGFSMKANTSRRSAYTQEVEKQQFVCNRFKKPGSEEVDVDKMINQSYVDDSDCSSDVGESDHSKSCTKKSGSSISSFNEKKKRN